MTRLWGAILSASVMFAAVPRAAAQPTSSQAAEEEAKAKFQAGKQAFRLGEYDEAIALWKEAYRLKDNPAFLFNIGLAYREKGDLPRAVQFLENYLKDAPANASNRADVEARVKELKKLIEDQKAASRRPPNEPVELTGDGEGGTGSTSGGTTGQTGGGATTTGAAGTQGAASGAASGGLGETDGIEGPRDGGDGGDGGATLRLAGIGVAVVGVGLLGTGLAYGLKASSSQDEVQTAIDMGAEWTQELEDKDAEGRSAAKLSTITLGLGAATVVGAGVLFYLGARKGKAESRDLSLVPSGRGLAVVGSF